MHSARPASSLLPLLAAACLAAAAFAPTVVEAQNTQSTSQSNSIDSAQLFSSSCGFCHQAGGRVQGRGPKLMGSAKSDDEIVTQIKNGKPPRMPAFGRSFSDEQIKAIVAYIRALK